MDHKNELHLNTPVCPLLAIAAAISGQRTARCLGEDCRLWDLVGQRCCLEYLADIAATRNE